MGAELLEAGLPPHLVYHVAAMAALNAQSRYDRMTDDVLKLTGEECAEVRPARLQLVLPRRFAVLEEERARGHRDDDVVDLMAVPAGRLARRKAPFGHTDTLVVDLDRGGRLRTRHARDSTLRT